MAAVFLGAGFLAGAFLGLAAFAAAAGFLAEAGAALVAFLGFGVLGLVGGLVVFFALLGVAGFFLAGPAAFFVPLAAADAGFLAGAFLASAPASLKEPEAPFPLVWVRVPAATADLRYFLMKGATLSASSL